MMRSVWCITVSYDAKRTGSVRIITESYIDRVKWYWMHYIFVWSVGSGSSVPGLFLFDLSITVGYNAKRTGSVRIITASYTRLTSQFKELT